MEKALGWVESLQARSFVGTESRLNTVFELLRQMVFGAETDPEARLAELRRRRDEIDADIARVEPAEWRCSTPRASEIGTSSSPPPRRELLADFREVEDNFRILDRELREQIAGWTGSKGELLDEVLGSRAASGNPTRAGASTRSTTSCSRPPNRPNSPACWSASSPWRSSASPTRACGTIHYDWLDAGERTQATVRLLSEQLRRFLDDQVWLENRRVMDILHSIESNALRVRQTGPST